MSTNKDYYLFFTNKGLDHLSDHVILVVPKEIAEEYRSFFSQFITGERVCKNYGYITIREARELTNKYKAIDWHFKEELHDPNIIPIKSEKEQDSPFAMDLSAVHLWFGIMEYWLMNDTVQLKKPEETLNITGTLIKMVHMVFE